MAELTRKTFDNGIDQILVDANPAVSGVKASQGSIAFGNIENTTKIYVKNGANDTDWVEFEPYQLGADTLARLSGFDDSLGLSTVSTIDGDTFRLTHDGSVVQYAEKNVVVTPKFRGKLLYLFTDVITGASSGNFKIIITDESNGSAVLADEVLVPQGEGFLTEKRRISFLTVSDTSLIKIRFEALAEAGSPTSDFDSVTIELAKTEKREITEYTQQGVEYYYTPVVGNFWDGSGTSALWDISLLVGDHASSDLFEIVDNFTTPSSTAVIIRALKKVEINLTADSRSTSPGELQIYVVKDGVEYLLTRQTTTDSNYHYSASSSAILDVGEYIYIRASTVAASREGSINFTVKPAESKLTRIEELSTFHQIVQEREDVILRAGGHNNEALTASDRIPFNVIEDSDGAWDGDTYTVPKSGIYNISGSIRTLAATTGQTIYMTVVGTGARYIRVGFQPGSAELAALNYSGYFYEGDEVYFQLTNAATLGTNLERDHNLNITSQSVPKYANAIGDSKIELPSSELRFENSFDRGNVATAILKWEAISKIRGDGFQVTTNDNDGTYITIKKAGKLTATANIRHNGATEVLFGITKNQVNLTATPAIGESIATESSDSGTEYMSMTGVTYVKPGDIIRVYGGADTNSSGQNNFTLILEETKVAVAITNIQPQFEDADSAIRVSGGNGFGSTETNIRRFSNVDSLIGEDIEYIDDPVLGGQFIAKTSGIYYAYFSEGSGASADSMAVQINLNGVFISRDRDSLNTASGSAKFCATSAAFYMNAGDVVTFLCVPGANSDGVVVSAGICKQGKPSIASADITPFVRVPQTITQSMYKTNTAGATLDLANPTTSFGSSLFQIISSDEIKILKDCIIDINASVTGVSNASSQTTNAIIQLNGTTIAYDLERSSGTSQTCGSAASLNIKLVKDDVIRIIANTNAPTTPFYAYSIVAQAQDLELIANTDLSEIPKVWSTVIDLATDPNAGDFTDGSILVKRVGDIVTVSVLSSLIHATLSSASSSNGLLPSWAIPDAGVNTAYLTESAGSRTIVIGSLGQLITSYYSATFSNVTRSSSGTFTISYNINDDQGTYDIKDVVFQIPSAKFKPKTLSSNITLDSVMSDLTYTGLVVGKAYELVGTFAISTTSSDTVLVTIKNGSTTVGNGRAYANNAGSGGALNTKFIATATTLTFEASSIAAGTVIQGGTEYAGTYVHLKQADNLQLTDDL